MNKELIRKYNTPGPRYTSYPTVPYWDAKEFDKEMWKNRVRETFQHTNSSKGISLYLHLPFCESLCHYCGCNVRRTVNHDVEEKYISYLKKEWLLYLDLFDAMPQITEIHLGGGTPTFFSAENLQDILGFILNTATIHTNHSFSLEADPRHTNDEQLRTLFDLGFKRISLGIQDFDPKVEEAINRVQSFDLVKQVTQSARKIGYNSVNFDLIYGLPLQTDATIEDTVNKTAELRPDRIAFYSYAHLPQKIGVQRKINEADLPEGDEKRKLYERGKELLEQHGYIEIGMDHFALLEDSLTRAYNQKTLHRNFMGYGTTPTDLLVGLGVSSIGDSHNSFGQNQKTIRNYEKALDINDFPVFKGHLHSREDLIIRKHILNLMCNFETSFENLEDQTPFLTEALKKLSDPEKDGLIKIEKNTITVTDNGKPFIRNICMALDAKLHREYNEKKVFSKTV